MSSKDDARSKAPGYSLVSKEELLNDVQSVFRTNLTNYDDPAEELPKSYQNEFPAEKTPLQLYFSDIIQSKGRQFRSAMSLMTEPQQIAALSASFGTVWAIGTYEGAIVQRQAHRSLLFAARYGLAQIIPSIIWMTKPPELVARRFGLDPSVVLRTFGNPTQLNASVQLRILKAQCVRSVIAGFLGIAQIFRLVQAFSDASNEYEERVRNGKEPFFTGTRERVIRLAGKSSDVTDLSTRRFKRHMVPIVEDPDISEPLVLEHSDNFQRPIMWHIPDDTYGRPSSWGAGQTFGNPDNQSNNVNLETAKFQIDYDWGISYDGGEDENDEGGRLIIVEADSSVGEQALALGVESANDMTVSEAALAFRYIDKLARKQGAILNTLDGTDRVVRVLLADSASKQTTGGGHEYTLREHVMEQDSADILIDAKLPLLKAIVEWAQERMAKNGTPGIKKMFFDTSNREYFETVSKVLAKHGWKVLDGGWHCSKEYSHIPVIVYDNSTAATVNTVRSLLKKRNVPPHMVCALLDQHEGQADLNRVTKELGCEGEVSSICSAVIYDYMFQSVRLLLRKGFRDDEIQRFLDFELGRIGSVEEEEEEERYDLGVHTSTDFFDLKFGDGN
jgi:hypothetical protein